MQTATAVFDPLDMRNYSLERLVEIKGGRLTEYVRFAGMPLAIFLFCFFHYRWVGSIGIFETQTRVSASACYSALGIFLCSLVLWITEAIPNYLTSFMIILAVIFTGTMKMRPAFAYLGEPVMILNIASFIMASSLVATGLAKRLSLYIVMRFFGHVNRILLAFIALNLILGAFISATSAKTALLLPLFMVIAAIFGATGGEYRNSVGRNMVLQNLLANNVSASAFMTGSAANLLAAQLLNDAIRSQNPSAGLFYGDWLLVLLPLAVLQLAVAWWTGTRLIFPITKEDATPKLEGGLERLREELQKLGKVSTDEIKAGTIFVLVLILWSTDRFHGIRAETVALSGAVAVLLPAFSGLPRIGVMKWNQADIPWHMLMFSWGAYALGGLCEKTGIVDLGLEYLFRIWNITMETPKVVVFMALSGVFGITTLVSQSKTARTIVMFPIIISTARKFNWDLVGFCLPMAFMINQVYVLYFNSKPANISYLTNQYSSWESFRFGFTQLLVIWLLLVPWAQYVMPLMGYDSRLW